MTTDSLPYPPTVGSKFRAFSAIVRKDWKQYWRYPLNAVSTVFQPVIWLAPVYFMGMAFSINGKAVGFAQYSGTTDYMSFLIFGAVLGNFVNAVFWGMGYALKTDMDAGVMESNWLTPIPRLLILMGRSVTNLSVTTITSLGMLVVCYFVFGFHPTGNLTQAVMAIAPMLIGLYGFGFAFAGLVLLMREANTLVDTSSFIVQVFSGTDFPVTVLPKWLLPISLLIPLTYGLDATRGLLLNTNTLFPIGVEIALLVVFMFVLLWFGSWVFHRVERKVRIMGTLGQH
jgi:ABC-2 type transport system permease protein